MKRLLSLLCAVVLALALCACGGDKGGEQAVVGNQIGNRCPATTLTEIDQNGYTDHTFDPTATGKVTVINFWAYWCPPCVNELPHFDEVAQKYADTVTVVAVHCDTVEKAQSFIGENYPDSAICFAMDRNNDPFVYYSTLGGSGSIPYTLVLDANGIIRQTFVGAITYDTLVAAVNACL